MIIWDQRGTLRLNQLNQSPAMSRLFGRVSRLGDGIAWYVLLVLLPVVDGAAGLQAALVMLIAGIFCTTLYKLLKWTTARPRPCDAGLQLHLTLAPLDRFSFPSGHTLHAVAFTVLATAYVPWLGLLLIPFTVLVALSRMVLGLHYPSDVLVGGLIGGVIGILAMPWI